MLYIVSGSVKYYVSNGWVCNRVFHKLAEIGNNGNIGFTIKVLALKCENTATKYYSTDH